VLHAEPWQKHPQKSHKKRRRRRRREMDVRGGEKKSGKREEGRERNLDHHVFKVSLALVCVGLRVPK
jgi:hypothetical protein